MIEIKNTKVRLYTVEEFKKLCKISVIPELERILELSEDKEIILISQLARRTISDERYYVAIPTEGSYEVVIINSEVIKAEIIDTGAKAAILDGIVIGTFDPEEQSDGLLKGLNLEKPPLGLIPREHYKRISNVSRIGDILDAMDRYIKKEKTLPVDWIDELRERIDILKDQS